MKSNLSRLSVFQAEELLEGNIDIFTTFISLIANSTRQLKQFQVANGSLTNKLEDLKRDAMKLISFLRRSMALIVSRYHYVCD